jgi:pimeloyl-ACP methyl ester carboxylesterase
MLPPVSGERAAIVLVHGAWHGSWCWNRVVPLLESQSFAVHLADLPSIDADPDDPSALSGDAAAVSRLLDEGNGPFLVCGHSYGGMVITRATAGRKDVARLVYLCAFMPDAGESLLSLTGGPAPWIREQTDGRTLPDIALAGETFYGDCEPEVQRAAIERLRPMLAAPFGEAVSHAAWREIPSTYVVCTEDMAIPVEWQRDVFAPRAEEVVELEASHSPFLSQPSVIADLLTARATLS